MRRRELTRLLKRLLLESAPLSEEASDLPRLRQISQAIEGEDWSGLRQLLKTWKSSAPEIPVKLLLQRIRTVEESPSASWWKPQWSSLASDLQPRSVPVLAAQSRERRSAGTMYAVMPVPIRIGTEVHRADIEVTVLPEVGCRDTLEIGLRFPWTLPRNFNVVLVRADSGDAIGSPVVGVCRGHDLAASFELPAELRLQWKGIGRRPESWPFRLVLSAPEDE